MTRALVQRRQVHWRDDVDDNESHNQLIERTTLVAVFSARPRTVEDRTSFPVGDCLAFEHQGHEVRGVRT